MTVITFDEFKTKMISEFTGYLPEEFRGEVKEVTNNKNNCVRTGMEIILGSVNPCLYFDSMYEAYIESEKEADEFLKAAAEMMAEQFSEQIGLFSNLLSSKESLIESMKDLENRIQIKVVNTDANAQLVENCPHRFIQNLTAVYIYIVGDSQMNRACITITNSIAKELGVTEEQLFEYARNGMLNNVMMHNISEFLHDNFEQEAPHVPMMILSNTDLSYGAGYIALPDVMKAVYQSFGEKNFWIIPSSVNELLVIPVLGEECDITSDEILEMIGQTNISHVAEEDRLSNTCYLYENGTIKMIGENTSILEQEG